MPTPVTDGWVAGMFAPPGIVTIAGEIATFDVSLLFNVTVTPPAGAAGPMVTAKGADCPNGTLRPEGRPIVPEPITVTVAVVSPKAGSELAWITAEPGLAPVTGTEALELKGATNTVAGTVATPGLLELRLKVTPPAGAGEERVSERFCVPPVPVMTRFDGERVEALPTSTTSLSPVKPEATAVITDEPESIPPVSVGWTDAVMEPSGMKTVVGLMPTFDVSLLLNVIKTPSEGADLERLIGMRRCSPTARVRPEGRMMSRPEVTVTPADAPETLGAPAETVAEPGATPFTATLALVAFAAKETVAGTVTAAELLELRLTVRPPAGAGTERFNCRFPMPTPGMVRAGGAKLSAAGGAA